MELQTMPLRFRVWDKEKHKMVATDLSIAQLVDFLHKDWQQGGWTEDLSYPQYEISQDTGHKVKGGKPMFTGDIVKVYDVLLVSAYRDGEGQFDFVHEKDQGDLRLVMGMPDWDEFEVVGNIWEDGERLLCPKE